MLEGDSEDMGIEDQFPLNPFPSQKGIVIPIVGSGISSQPYAAITSNTVYSANFDGWTGNLETHDTWTRMGANSAVCSSGVVTAVGSGERTYNDGKTPNISHYTQADCYNSGAYVGVLVRATTSSTSLSYYWGYYDKSIGAWKIDQCSSGTITNLASFTQGGQANTLTLRLSVDTAQIVSLYNCTTGDPPVLKCSTTGLLTYTSGTGGIRSLSESAGTWDNYSLVNN